MQCQNFLESFEGHSWEQNTEGSAGEVWIEPQKIKSGQSFNVEAFVGGW